MSASTAAEPHGEGGEAGFTLVELLAALGLMSLLSVIILGSLRLGLKTWERAATYGEHVNQVALVQGVLRRTVEDAYPFFVPGALNRGQIAFNGTANSLQMLSSISQALASGGRAQIAIEVARNPERSDLTLLTRPELAADSDQSTRKVLLADVQAVEFSYFGKSPRSQREAVWREQWTDEYTLPQLVRIRVVFPPDDTRTWPDLVIAPRIAADVGCVYDLLTKRCRGR